MAAGRKDSSILADQQQYSSRFGFFIQKVSQFTSTTHPLRILIFRLPISVHPSETAVRHYHLSSYYRPATVQPRTQCTSASLAALSTG